MRACQYNPYLRFILQHVGQWHTWPLAGAHFTHAGTCTSHSAPFKLRHRVLSHCRVMAYLDRPPAPQLSAGLVPERIMGQLDVEGVSFAYPSRPDQLALVSLACLACGPCAWFEAAVIGGGCNIVALAGRRWRRACTFLQHHTSARAG